MKKFLLIFSLCFLFFAYKAKAHNPPIPEFSALDLCAGDSVHFINQTTGGIYYTWYIFTLDTATGNTTLIDSANSTDLTYLFPALGYYSVRLVADNGHVVEINKEIKIGNETHADFSFMRCANQFVNMSTCSNTYFWDFGDGNTDASAILTHVYADTGHYVVTLVVSNGVFFDTLADTIFVDETGYPDAAANIVVSNDTLYGYLLNPPTSTGTVTWYFDDGTTANTNSIIHQFDSVGTHVVTIRIFNACGMVLQTDTFIVAAPAFINEKIASDNFSIYPNPAKEYLKIARIGPNKGEPFVMSVFDQMGSKIHTEEVVGKDVLLDVSQWLRGIYLIQLESGNNYYSKKNYCGIIMFLVPYERRKLNSQYGCQ